jgi:hypothetical protein
MPNSRRTFLRSAALAAAPVPAATVQVPKMKFGPAEISRLIVGCNPFYGFSHFNKTLSTVMKEYFTPERVCAVLHQCNRFGINAYNYVHYGRAQADYERFQGEGGQMHLILQALGDPEPAYRAVKPLAMYLNGEMAEEAFERGQSGSIREWCKKARQTGALVGVGTHNPAIIEQVESEGWDVDFYAACVYNRTRTPEQWKQVFHGELPEMPGEIYLQSDPARMYQVIRQVKRPCFAFKIMAAGRISEKAADQAFRTAYENIKPTDGVFIGLFPRVRDEVRENAERTCRVLGGGAARGSLDSQKR